jgi:hypothetical protein
MIKAIATSPNAKLIIMNGGKKFNSGNFGCKISMILPLGV